MRRRQRITKRAVDALAPGLYLWDSELSGFYARRTKAGHASYGYRYRYAGRRQRFHTIGAHGSPWTPDDARREAVRLAAAVAQGQDPAATKAERRQTPTVRQLAARYMLDHAHAKKKPRSAKGDEINLRRHILPVLGDRLISEVTRADIARLHRGMADTPATANRCLALLSKMFSLAETWGQLPPGSTLTKGVQKYPEKARQRFLSDEEVRRLLLALKAHQLAGLSPYIVALFTLLLLTGARLAEIQTARWDQVDWKTGQLVLTDSKTGPKSIPLSQEALDILRSLPALEGNPYLLPGVKAGAHLVGVQKAWQRIRADAALPDVRIHDLRHSFASMLARHGFGLQVIGGVLGHRHTATTARYAHLLPSTVRDAAATASLAIAAQGAEAELGGEQPERPSYGETA